MARGVNKVSLIGNVGAEPEVRQTSTGKKIARFSLATNRAWANRTTGEQLERTDWHRIVVWDRLAEIVEQYVHKGDKLYVEGRIEYSSSEGDDGVTRYWTDIVVQELVMLGSSGGTEGSPAPASQPRRASKETPRQQAAEATAPAGPDPQDDLPF